MCLSRNALLSHRGTGCEVTIATGRLVWESPERFLSTPCSQGVMQARVAYAAVSLEQSHKGDGELLYGGEHVLFRVTPIAALPALPAIAVLFASGLMAQGGSRTPAIGCGLKRSAGSLLRDGFGRAAPFKSCRIVIAVGCVLVATAGCSARLVGGAPVGASTLEPARHPAISGIGAKRVDWDATHTPNPAFNNEMVYGQDASLPSYLAANAAVYIEVSDLGTDRIQSYWLNMHTAARDHALARVLRELPSDASVAWDLSFNHCFRIAFASATLEAAGNYMAEVQLEDLKPDGTMATRPRTFNQAKFQLDASGSPPNPQIDCRHRIRESTLDLRAETLRPAGQAARGSRQSGPAMGAGAR